METLNVPFKPWEYHTYTEMKYIFWRSHHRGVMDHSYKAVFETLPNYDNSYWKPGFVVRFGDGINSWQRDRWETWFLTGEDKKRFEKENDNSNLLRAKELKSKILALQIDRSEVKTSPTNITIIDKT